MVKKILVAIVMLIAFMALLQGNVFAAEFLPEPVDGVITLTEDVEADYFYFIEESVTVNLNGFNITCRTDAAQIFYVNNPDVVLTIEGNGNITSDGPNVWVNAGKAVLKGGTYHSKSSNAVYAQGSGHIEVLNGTYSCNSELGYVVNIHDASRATASISVFGGTFINWDPSNNGAEGEGTNFLAEGYNSVKEGSNYKVVDDDFVLYDLKKSDGTLTLDRDYVLDYYYYIQGSETVNLNGFNIIHRTKGNSPAFYVDNPDFVLTIVGEGNVISDGPTVWVNAGKAVLKGGTYHSESSNTVYVTGNGHIDVVDGTYSCNSKLGYVVNIHDDYRETGSISVFGGTFKNWDPSNNGAEGAGTNFVADAYKSVKNGENYNVVCAHKTCALEVEKPATYVAEGSKAYYVCNICSKWFKTWSEGNEATEEITDKSSIVIPKLIEVNDKEDEVVVKEEAVDNAVADATANNTDVVIPLGNIGTTVSSVELPVEKLEVVAGTDKALVVETTEAVVTLDTKTLEEVVKQAGEETTITIEVKKIEEDVLAEKQQAVIENKEVAFVFKAEIFANGTEISKFNGGKVKVAIPFTPEENTNASDYKVFYIADDGSISEVLTQYVDGKIVVELEHFSEYALINVNKVVNQGGTGSAAPAPAPATKDNTPKTGAASVVVAMMAIAGAGYMLTRKEER